MRAFVSKTDTRIMPFNEHPQELLIQNKKLLEHQNEILKQLGIEYEQSNNLTSESERIIFKDTVFFSKRLIESFIEKSRKIGKPTQCILKKGNFTKTTVSSVMDLDDLGQSLGYRLYYIPSSRKVAKEFFPVEIDPDEFIQNLRFPQHLVDQGKYPITITTKILVQIEHWTNLWACNLQNMLSRIAKLKGNRFKQLRLALTSFSKNQWKVLEKNVKIGKNCDIHPTAYIEDSIIGDGVEIGANCVIRGSMIGDSSVLMNNVNVIHSVLGNNCQLWDGVTTTYSLLFSGSFVTARLLNCSVLGRNSFLPNGTIITDLRFDDRNVKILKDGKLYDSGNRFLGFCLGHDSYLGSGIVVEPGREIPNNVKLVPKNNITLSSFDKLEGFKIFQK